MGGGVAPQFVGDELGGDATLALQQAPEEAEGSLAVAARLHQDIQHIPVLVDSARGTGVDPES